MIHISSKLMFLLFGSIISHSSCGPDEIIYPVSVDQLLELQPVQKKAQYAYVSYHHSRIFENHRILQDFPTSPNNINESYGDTSSPVPPLPARQRLNAPKPKPKTSKSPKSKVGKLSDKEPSKPLGKGNAVYTMSSPNKTPATNRSEASSSSRSAVCWDTVLVFSMITLSFLL